MHSRKIHVLLYRSSRLEVFCKKYALKISQNSQKNTCVRASLLKKRLQRRCFPERFGKILKTSFSHYRILTFNLIVVFMFSTLTKLKLNSDSHLPKTMMKNAFYFILKALDLFSVSIYLNFCFDFLVM